MVCFGRHTITGLLRLQNRTRQDWTADYRLYAQKHFDEDKIFSLVRTEVQEQLSQDAPLVTAMDDSLLRKTGRKISGVRYLRDPMSPPFPVNFVRGLRVLQISAALPQGTTGAARLIPVDFRHAPLPAKPRQNAPASDHQAYEQERKQKNINLVAGERLALLRQRMNESGSSQRQLITSIDGRLTNRTLLEKLPAQTTIIGRVRKDARFFHPPEEQTGARTQTKIWRTLSHSGRVAQKMKAGRGKRSRPTRPVNSGPLRSKPSARCAWPWTRPRGRCA
jgi:hypothetical protein